MTKAEIIQKIEDLEFDEAIDGLKAALPKKNDVILVASRWKGLERDNTKGILSTDYYMRVRNQISHALLELAERLPDDAPRGSGNGNGANGQGSKPKVFISYNHNDADMAAKVMEKLRANDIDVTIDSETIESGEDIDSYIMESVKSTDFTVSLVSTNSLLSGWVAKETLLTMFKEKLDDGTGFKFIACALDGDFFRDEFIVEAGKKLNEDIQKLDELMEQLKDMQMKTTHLDVKKGRLQDLKHHLPDILDRLLGAKTEDISGDKFESGIANVIRKIKPA